MDIVHIKITFVDTFSKVKEVKSTTVSEYTYKNMLKNDIGKIVKQKTPSITYLWEIKSIEQC